MQMIFSIFSLLTVIFLRPCTRTMVVVLIDFVYRYISVWTALSAILHLESFVLSSSLATISCLHRHGLSCLSNSFVDDFLSKFRRIHSCTFTEVTVLITGTRFCRVHVRATPFHINTLGKPSLLNLVPSIFSICIILIIYNTDQNE